MLKKSGITVGLSKDNSVTCVSWNRSINTNLMLWFPHVNDWNTKKNVVLKIHTVLGTKQFTGERGKELVNTQTMENASEGPTKQPQNTCEWNQGSLENSIFKQGYQKEEGETKGTVEIESVETRKPSLNNQLWERTTQNGRHKKKKVKNIFWECYSDNSRK